MNTRGLRLTAHWLWLLLLLVALAAGCSETPEPSKRTAEGVKPLNHAEAERALARLRSVIHVSEVPLGQVEPIATGTTNLEDTLPDISTFPMVVDPVQDNMSVVAEVFTSTEKSGSGTDGWMVEVAKKFNEANKRTSNGKLARIAVRKIASGTAYEFIASRKYVPEAFTPSNELWGEMAQAQGAKLTRITDRLAGNIAGLVMKTPVAEKLKAGKPRITVADVVNAAIQGKLVIGYTNPFASSTGMNFLVTVLQTFAGGEESAMLSPAVASAFENFQKSVPFVALTTMQMRDSVEKDGSLEAFVLEYQTFVQTPSLRSGYDFIPFGFRHDNPLYAVGSVTTEKMETLRLFARFAQEAQPQKLATEYGFNPKTDWKAPFKSPSGWELIEAQKLWKQKKDAGRPIAAVFLADVSGSMRGTKIQQLRRAMVEGGSFISSQNAIGLASFASGVSILLPIKPFQLLQRSAFQAAVKHLDAEGNTAMYDGIIVALSMLLDYKKANPDVRPMIFVLTDGQTNAGLHFQEVADIITGLRVPVYTIGFEADLKELGRLSSLVEAASLSASEADLRYKIGALLNSQM
jgi:Ca-activated chloride channel homolog